MKIILVIFFLVIVQHGIRRDILHCFFFFPRILNLFRQTRQVVRASCILDLGSKEVDRVSAEQECLECVPRGVSS